MPTRLRNQNGTSISSRPSSQQLTATAAASQSQGIANNTSNPPKLLTASIDGQLVGVRLRLPREFALDVSDVSASPDSGASASHDDSGSVYEPSLEPSLRRSRRVPKPTQKRQSAMRGPMPRKFSWERVEGIDFGCTKSINAHMPRYKGRGQLDIPLYLLLDKRGNVNPNKKWCFGKVSWWNNLTEKKQREVVDFNKAVDKELRKLLAAEKKMAERAAKEAGWNAARTKNRREKRQRERAAAATAGEGGEEEEEQQVSLLCVCVSLYVLKPYNSQSSNFCLA